MVGMGMKTACSAGRPVLIIGLDCGGIAQLVERLVRNEKVRGSNPLTSTPRNRARSPYRARARARGSDVAKIPRSPDGQVFGYASSFGSGPSILNESKPYPKDARLQLPVR